MAEERKLHEGAENATQARLREAVLKTVRQFVQAEAGGVSFHDLAEVLGRSLTWSALVRLPISFGPDPGETGQ